MKKEDKEAIIRRLEAMYGEAEDEDNETKEALFYAVEALKKQRPHGEWIEKHCDYGVYYRCSNCHKMPPNYECDYKEGAIKTNFCPNCGASMRKEGEQNE